MATDLPPSILLVCVGKHVEEQLRHLHKPPLVDEGEWDALLDCGVPGLAHFVQSKPD